MIEACDGQVGLKLAGQFRPDLILLDLNMPNMDGYQVLQELEKNAATAGIPVAIVTSMTPIPQNDPCLMKAVAVLDKKDLSPDVIRHLMEKPLALRREVRMV